MKLSEEDMQSLAQEIEYSFKTESGQIKKEKRVIEKCTGQRREMECRKKEYEYVVKGQINRLIAILAPR